MQVKTFDDKRLKRLMAECDPYLLQYIEALKLVADGWKGISQKAIKKLREGGGTQGTSPLYTKPRHRTIGHISEGGGDE